MTKRLLSLSGVGHAVNMSATTGTPLSEQSILATFEDVPDSSRATAVRLMMAAADAFADKGFHATTTRDIASRAGLSPAGVYVHFTSKEDLLFDLSRRGHQTARDMLVAAAEAADSPTEALQSIIGGFSKWHAEHREVVLGLRREIDKVVRDVLSDGVERGEFEVEDVHATSLALLSMAVDVARWYSPEIRRTPDDIARTNGDLAIRLVARR